MKGGPFTVSEVARMLDVGQETVRRYIREEKLKAEKKKTKGLRKVWVVSADELRRFQNG